MTRLVGKFIGVIATAIFGIVLFGAYFLFPSERVPNDAQLLSNASFKKTVLPFQHIWSAADSHSLVGSAAIDIDGNGTDEIFIGGSEGQQDALFRWQNGKAIDIAETSGLGDLSATYGAVSIDIDKNGHVDLLTVGNDGLSIWLNDNAKFQKVPIAVSFAKNSVPVDLSVADFDRDGDLDIYLSMFVDPTNFRSPVFNDPDHAKPNMFLRNDGGLKFTDITDAVTGGLQNTFVSSFIDLDGDGLQDLVLAQNTGQLEILKNIGEKGFEKQNFDSGFGFWMGLAIADYDTDGDPDLFFSNIGNSIPSIVLKGDIRADQALETEWLLLRNDGNFEFTDVTETAKLNGFGFGWGSSFSDVNLDGNMDLMVAQNYIKWPIHKFIKHPSKLMLGSGQDANIFYQSDAIENSNFGMNPLIVDVDGNGKPDVVWVNIDGHSILHINKKEADFLAFRFPDTLKSAGAHIAFDLGELPTLYNIAGQGLGSDPSTLHTIGIEAENSGSHSATIFWANGEFTKLDSIVPNTIIDLGLHN